MKSILKFIAIITSVIIICIGLWTNIFSNSWGLITGQGFIIPAESSIVNFKVTMMNNGSGEWWLYGEDNNYYYTTMVNDNGKGYCAIPKSDTFQCIGFDKFNYKAWCRDK
ncbi:MAG: hypothetical protein HYU69_13650 [Bacteroidetes bacterium]|nr:hypothetical protein [Bacteroidota bacterium]